MKRLLVKLTNPIFIINTIMLIVIIGAVIVCDTYKYRYEVASAYAEQLEQILEDKGYDTAIGSDEQIAYDALKH
jgi:hypothetical protein